MVTEQELQVSGENLSKSHRKSALLLGAMRSICSHVLLRYWGDDKASADLMVSVLDDCVAARQREIDVEPEEIDAAAADMLKLAKTIRYINTLPP